MADECFVQHAGAESRGGKPTPTEQSKAALTDLVERIRVATFEAPEARSHAEWKSRIEALFITTCGTCGCIEGVHEPLWIDDDTIIQPDNDHEFWPLVVAKGDTDG